MKKGILIILLLFLTSCTPKPQIDEKDQALSECQKLCNQKLSEGLDLSNSPCLSNEIIPNWVCDVAHKPRQDIDNIPENQCSAFREGKAIHFVELDKNCNLIKTY